MTHKDILTKFLIGYDKANVTSSYPSLTEYEIATLLDKAYLALIAQKTTGNNIRRATLESDVKAVSDLAPLIVHKDIPLFRDSHTPAVNIVQYSLPDDFLYYVSSALNYGPTENAYDSTATRLLPAELVPHKTAEKFFSSQYNMPWIKNPVCYVEGNTMYTVYDPINKPNVSSSDVAHLSYIKRPISFVQGGNTHNDDPNYNRAFILNKSKLNIIDTLA